ncbi:MAG: methyltransferase, partial [Gemmatimonadota bacterium]
MSALARCSRARDIRRGSFGTLGEVRLAASYDLVVVCDVLQYVPDRELNTGLSAIADRLGGVVYLEAYATEDAIEGDHADWHHRSAEQ